VHRLARVTRAFTHPADVRSPRLARPMFPTSIRSHLFSIAVLGTGIFVE
jgi:hypothetical protein